MADAQDLLAGMAPAGGLRKLFSANLRRLLEHPLTVGLNLDDPKTTQLRKQIIASKPFLRAIYDEWYSKPKSESPGIPGAVPEMGTGARHCENFIPRLVTWDITHR